VNVLCGGRLKGADGYLSPNFRRKIAEPLHIEMFKILHFLGNLGLGATEVPFGM
jgi:hypothetical protein